MFRSPSSGHKVFKELCKQDGNVGFSPFSLDIALSMTAAGVALESKAMHELKEFLGEEEKEKNKNTFKFLTSQKTPECCQMLIANSIWTKEGEEGGIKEDFVKEIKEVYNGDFLTFNDFTDINLWVQEKTKGEIKEILHQNPIDMVLLNVLYFQGNWLSKFDPAQTTDKLFKIVEPCRMMNAFSKKFKTGETVYSEYVFLPYSGGNDDDDENRSFWAMVVLPKKTMSDTVNDLFDSKEGVMKAFDSSGPEVMNFSMPVFEIECGKSLKETLENIDIKTIFTNGEMSRLSTADTKVSDVFQKVVVKVDEKGTKASAVTAVMATRGAAPKIPHFVVDRPFLFVVFEEETKSTLFSLKVETLKNRV